MGFVAEVKFPVTDGTIVTAIRTALTVSWSTGLTVQRKLPATLTNRMVTVRNDSGPQDRQSLRRYGINVWADDSLEAEQIALDAMAGLRSLAGTGAIAAADQFSGPFEIDDDPPFTVSGESLTHFYFTFRATVRGTRA